jgi:hypothetical protein
MTLDDGTKTLDSLFGTLERSPFRGKDTNLVAGEDNNVDEAVMQAVIATREAIQASGSDNDFANGGFWEGPDDPDSPISEDDNPLSSWELVDLQGVGCVVTWGALAASPSEYGLTFTMTDGSASDETYFEQEVPIANAYRWLVATLYHVTDNVNLQAKVALQFLDAAGLDVGSEMSGTWSSLSAQIDRLFRTPPSPLAVSVRVRFGVVATAGFTGTQTVEVMFISGLHPQVYSVEIPGLWSYATPSGSTVYTLFYPTDIISSAAAMFKPDLPGFVLGISAKTDDTISAGTGTVRMKNDTQVTNPGPTVALSTGVTEAIATQYVDGASSYDFEAGDGLHLELSTDGSYASTGEADYVGSARLLLVIHDSNDW